MFTSSFSLALQFLQNSLVKYFIYLALHYFCTYVEVYPALSMFVFLPLVEGQGGTPLYSTFLHQTPVHNMRGLSAIAQVAGGALIKC